MVPDDYKKAMMWVVSLAVSVAACAALFVFLANALLDNQKTIITLQAQQEWLQAKLINTENSIAMLRSDMTRSQGPSLSATRLDGEPDKKSEKEAEPQSQPAATPAPAQ